VLCAIDVQLGKFGQPLFGSCHELFETAANAYEVIDGQQRITAIQEFFSNNLRLVGLEHWPELDGRTYTTLPAQLRAGIERRSITYVVVLRETVADEEEALFIKQTLFERLNTGGIKLSAQEVRNNLYQGPFNQMIWDLAETPLFKQIWLPRLAVGREERRSEADFFSSMQDLEVILRFFALRHHDKFRGSIKHFLDLYMSRSRSFDQATIQFLKDLYLRTLQLGHDIYGRHLFCEFSSERNAWKSRPLRAVADAVMIALNDRLEQQTCLAQRREEIVSATEELFRRHPKSEIIGRLNTAADVRKRIELFQRLFGPFCEAR
jgi:hypothetical protein